MMKSICALSHRPDSDRAAFQRYYEENHAPLAIKHFPFARYVRNHVIDGDVGFDTISEFWATDIPATAALMEGAVGDLLRADEEKFMDRSVIAPAGAEEHILSEGRLTDAAGERYATLFRRSEDEEGAFRDDLLGWARSIGQRMPGVSIDFATSWRAPAFPAYAALWTPATPVDVPNRFGRVAHVRVRRHETPVEQLLGNAA